MSYIFDCGIYQSALIIDHSPPFFFRSVTSLNLKSIFGFILNVPSDFKILGMFGLPLGQKHWIAIKWIEDELDLSGGSYFNLDSNLKYPEQIGNVSKYNLKSCFYRSSSKIFHQILLLSKCVVQKLAFSRN